ncbi:MAG: stage II sporulation protein P [Aristaeellaceae bacterium]
MRMGMLLLALSLLLCPRPASAEMETVWQITCEDKLLTEICYEPEAGDQYISADNRRYEIISVADGKAVAKLAGEAILPSVDWLDADTALPVSALTRRIALYCTHSDESYEPSDGFYTTTERGTIYQVAQTLAEELASRGVEATAADTLHHPHDAGAYRRSRQTAVSLLKNHLPDALIDIHRDGIPDPASYAVTIGGKPASKIRLLVGRGNQNAEINKEFALTIKAVADHVYPGLIKDIYMGKGTFNQDLLPKSILFECGTYTLERERVLASMPMMADVLNRTLYGGITGSAGRITSDAGAPSESSGGITMGEADPVPGERAAGVGSGVWFLALLLIVGILGFAILSTGTFKGGANKAARNLSEMTGGLIGKKPSDHEDPEHS